MATWQEMGFPSFDEYLKYVQAMPGNVPTSQPPAAGATVPLDVQSQSPYDQQGQPIPSGFGADIGGQANLEYLSSKRQQQPPPPTGGTPPPTTPPSPAVGGPSPTRMAIAEGIMGIGRGVGAGLASRLSDGQVDSRDYMATAGDTGNWLKVLQEKAKASDASRAAEQVHQQRRLEQYQDFQKRENFKTQNAAPKQPRAQTSIEFFQSDPEGFSAYQEAMKATGKKDNAERTSTLWTRADTLARNEIGKAGLIGIQFKEEAKKDYINRRRFHFAILNQDPDLVKHFLNVGYLSREEAEEILKTMGGVKQGAK